MRNAMIVAAATLGLTGTAYAGDLAFVGETEYAIEAETFSVEAGAEYAVGDFTITPLAKMDDVNGDFDFTGAELEVGYAVTTNVTIYGRVEADDDFEYDEALVGPAFRS